MDPITPSPTTMQTEGEKLQITLVLSPTYTPPSPTSPSLSVPPTPIAIPSDTRRRGLSAVVNHLLDRRVPSTHPSDSSSSSSSSEDDEDEETKLPALNFDFLVADRLLRTSVETAARRSHLSLETAVTVVYFPSRDTPTGDGETEPLPQWITSLLTLHDHDGDGGLVAAGGGDGVVRVYGAKGMECTGSVEAHSGKISSMAVLGGGEKGWLLASGSMDQTLVTHRVGKNGGDLVLHGVYTGGHTSSVDSVAAVGGTEGDGWMASGDWSGGLCVWKVPAADGPTDGDTTAKTKKTKRENPTTVTPSTTATVHETTPTISLRPHSSSLSGLSFSHASSPSSPPKTLLTCSWDHSLKSIDLETRNVVTTLAGSKVATCLTRCGGSDVVASGHPDCTVRLWDMRVGGGGGGGSVFLDGTLRPSHNAWISAVEWTNDPYVLTSASHDGTVKVWDIRSSLPLHTVRAHAKGEKALCLAVSEEAVFSGGSDCVVKKFRF